MQLPDGSGNIAALIAVLLLGLTCSLYLSDLLPLRFLLARTAAAVLFGLSLYAYRIIEI